MDVVSVSTLNDIPKNASLLIYGAGGRGLRFEQLLTKHRGAVTILGLLDSNKSGTIQP